MGYSLSWLAAEGPSRAELLARVGLEEVGPWTHADRLPPLGCLVTPSGWAVLLAGDDLDFVTPGLLAAASAGSRAVGAYVEEHVMFTAALGYRDGAAEWAALHDPDRGDVVVVAGDPPAELSGIGELGDFDPETPIDLAEALTGFRHDLNAPQGPWDAELIAVRPRAGAPRPGGSARGAKASESGWLAAHGLTAPPPPPRRAEPLDFGEAWTEPAPGGGLFSTRGRSARRAFLLASLGLLAGFAVVGAVGAVWGLERGAIGFAVAVLGVLAPALSLFLACASRRLHDLGRSGLWLLLPVVVLVVGLKLAEQSAVSLSAVGLTFAAVMAVGLSALSLLPGTRGPNAYGPDPRAP